MATIEKFEEVIKDLKALKKFPPPVISIDREGHLNELVIELRQLKNQVIEKRIQAVKDLASIDGSAIKISSFELMQYKFNENSHSNILQYIFDYELLGHEAAEILADFIFNIPELENKEQLKEKILKMNYTVEREKSVAGGRIDLFISDTKNKFIIIIENKLLASVADKADTDNGVKQTQLDNYLKYAKRNFSSCEQACILLSYEKLEEDYRPFVKVDYDYLNNVVLKDKIIEDDIFNDYKLLLRSLYSSADKLNLKRELYKIINNKDLSYINLSDIEDLKKELK